MLAIPNSSGPLTFSKETLKKSLVIAPRKVDVLSRTGSFSARENRLHSSVRLCDGNCDDRQCHRPDKSTAKLAGEHFAHSTYFLLQTLLPTDCRSAL